MTLRKYKDESRKNWGTDGRVGLEEIQLGAILRIADAAEKMCRDREELERKYQNMRAGRDRYREYLEAERRKNAALRGVITKLKRKQGGEA